MQYVRLEENGNKSNNNVFIMYKIKYINSVE